MKKKRLLILTLASLLMASCCYSIFVKYPGIQVINNSDYTLYVFKHEVAFESGHEPDWDWSVNPHSTRTIRCSMYCSDVKDFMINGVLHLTFVNKDDVGRYSWTEIIDNKIFLYEYFVTEDQLQDYLIDERTLSFTYPPKDKE